MLRFLREAFMLRVPTRAFGAIPLNLLFVSAMSVLGVGHPGFWFLGAGLELSYLMLMVSNSRFQQYVLSMAKQRQRETLLMRLNRILTAFAHFTEEHTRLLVAVVPADRQIPLLHAKGSAAPPLDLARYNTCAEKVASILDRYQADNVAAALIRNNEDSLHGLLVAYAELLYNRAKLASLQTEPSQIEGEIKRLREELAARTSPPEIAESKQATLATLERRLEGSARRRQSLARIDSDLERVEQQIELAREAALGGGDISRINADLDIASICLADEMDLGSAPYPQVPDTPRGSPPQKAAE
jgi:hypothetical protein